MVILMLLVRRPKVMGKFVVTGPLYGLGRDDRDGLLHHWNDRYDVHEFTGPNAAWLLLVSSSYSGWRTAQEM